jgi:hypothetical protein
MNVYLNQFNTATDQNLLPLSAGLIASAAMANDEIRRRCTVHIRAQRGEAQSLARAFEDPFIIGFSCYSWNFRQSLAVAKSAKELFPKCHVTCGGPEIPRAHEAIKQFFEFWPFVDSIALGEGEITFRNTVLALLSGADLSTVAGLAFSTENREVLVNSQRNRISDFGALPSPFLDGTFDEFLLHETRPVTGALWETNRGCPFSCSFCDWGQSTKSRIRDVPLGRLIEEMRWIGQHRLHFVWATDANFGIRPQDVDIAHLLAETRRRFGYPRALSVSWAKNCPDRVREIYQILQEANIECQVTLTMQSFNQATLAAVNRSNIKLASFDTLKEDFGNQGIPTYSEFILPLPEETYDSFMDGLIRSLTRHGRDFFAINLCRLIPNTELATHTQRVRYGFDTRICEIKVARRVTDRDAIPEFEEMLVGTNTMPVADWARAVQAAFLLSALYNHRLGDVILNILRDHFGLEIKEFIGYILWQSDLDPPLFRRIKDNLISHIASTLRGGTPMVKVPEYGDYFWEPNESTYLIAAINISVFLAELERLTIDYLSSKKFLDCELEILSDLFRFQSSIIPRHHENYPFERTFHWDWYTLARRPFGSLQDHRGEFRYSFDLNVPEQKLALNEQCVRGDEPQSPSEPRAFAMAQIKVTAVGLNAICKVKVIEANLHDAVTQ